MLRSLGMALLVVAGTASGLYSAERDPLQSRVPPDQQEVARKALNPLQSTPQNIQKGKVVFDGKGTCFTCHGIEGKGDGPAAVGLDPSPRNFTNAAFQAARSDGELMWTLRHGSPGTAMIPLVGSAITEEEAWYVLLYVRSLVKSE